jgi:septal ring factor EnvC (AmiA/AmiB activator)
VSEYVTRIEYVELLRKIDAIDTVGTRGVAVLGVQLQEVAKDVAKLEKQMDDHRAEHQAAENARVTGRRWLIAVIIAAVAAIDGPMVTILLARGH